jgi:hypothetical protein
MDQQPADTGRPREPQTASASSAKKTPSERYDVHCILQSKGGIGKSVVAIYLTQWLGQRCAAAFDLDPLNCTLSSFKSSLPTRHVPVLLQEAVEEGQDEEQAFDVRAMDGVIEQILHAQGHVVVDNGSSTFVPVAFYLIDNDIPSVLAEHGKRLVVHTVLAAGQPALDTLAGMDWICRRFPEQVPVVVWRNGHFGKFAIEGKSLEETSAFTSNASRISAVIDLPHWRSQTHGRAVSEMLMKGLGFAQAEADPKTFVVEKSRLRQVKAQLWGELNGKLKGL